MRNTLVCTVVLAASLVIGYQIDSLQYFLRNYASQTFDYGPSYWFAGATPVVIAALEVALAWFVLVRIRMPWAAAIVYLVVGLAAAFFPLLFFGLHIQFLPFDVTPLAQTLTSHMSEVGAFSAIMGFIGAMFNLGKRRLVSAARAGN